MNKPRPCLPLAFLIALVFPALAVRADDTFTIPAGTTLHVRLTTTLSTRTNQNGDPWTGRVIEPIIVESQEVVPGGSIVEGRVAFVKEPGRVKGVAEMRLVPEAIISPEDVRYAISAVLEEARGAEGARVEGEEGMVKGRATKKADAVKTGVGAGVGAGTGAIIGGSKGALYGAGIGAAAGLLHSLFKRGKDIILPQGTELTIVIARNVTVQKVEPPAESPSESQ